MACKQTLAVLLLVVAAALGPVAAATEHVVVWNTGVNYTAWAEGIQFLVGDTLVFKYPQGAHNVIKANVQAFGSCQIPNGVQPLETGNDVIPLASPGEKYYFCGKLGHCDRGQKLAITVVTEDLKTPASSPAVPPSSGSSTRVAATVYGSLVAVVMAIVMA